MVHSAVSGTGSMMETPLPRFLIRFKSYQVLTLLLGILLLSSIGLLHSPTMTSNVTGLLQFLSFSTSVDKCTGVRRWAPLSPHGPIHGAWIELQQLVDSHGPVPSRTGLFSPISRPNLSTTEEKLAIPSTAPESAALRSIHEDLIAHLPTQPPATLYSGQGIVMVGGGVEDEFAATSLGMLRLLGSRLPAELWYLDQSSTKPGWCRQLAAQGVACRYLSDYVTNATALFPFDYQRKAAALLFSPFADILFLGPSTIPVRNPDGIFESQPYRDTGLVVWPDFWWSNQSPWTDYIIGTSSEAAPQLLNYGTLDAAQFMWDKKRHWKALLLMYYYNHHSPFYHPLLEPILGRSFGATLLTSLRTLHVPFYTMPFLSPIPLSSPDGSPDVSGGGVCVLHVSPLDPSGQGHIFLHTSIVRFSLRELMCDKSCIEKPTSAAGGGYQRPTEHQRIVGTRVRTMGAIATQSDWLHARLVAGQRLLSWTYLAEMGLDTERGIWMVLERLACEERSVWREGAVCENVRRFTEGAFGNLQRWRGECQA